MSQPLVPKPTQPETLRPEGTRKGPFSSSEQRARKRASDREAQRRIRARTKDYIVYMERELAQLKNRQWRDRTIQELLQRNEATERELIKLRRTLVALENGSFDESKHHYPKIPRPDSYSTLELEGMNFAARAEACFEPDGFHHPMYHNSLHNYNGLEALPTNISELSDDPFSSILSPSSADYVSGYTPSNSAVPAGFNVANDADGTYPYNQVDHEFATANNAGTALEQSMLVSGYNKRISYHSHVGSRAYMPDVQLSSSVRDS
ncbi:hypothetical protein FLONG3_6558 [Fusarium longipes]|uniref:BZIP domain-containing protein n=1 Tax=Fusarium longipes TaxID=694270 RepID=A0A395SKF4_9HYPO|nr:hypothetical protein FLONG3_6558 [Fusarium longipes]